MVEFINELVEISSRKISLLEKIAVETKSQTEAIEKEDMKKLDQNINNKQALIDEINVLDNNFDAIFNKIKEKYGVNKRGDILRSNDISLKDLQSKIQKILKIIEEIKSIEDKNHKRLSARKDELGKKMREISKGKMAKNIYSGKPIVPPNPAFIDKKK